VKIGGEWKIKQYVLSMTVPNENVNALSKSKPIEDKLISRLSIDKNILV
jgi:hypothetical protein